MSTTRTSRLWRGPAWLVLFVGMALIATPIWALDVPPLTGRIVDVAHVLPTDLAATLTRDLQDHETKTGNQVAVLILPSLEGEPLEEFSHGHGDARIDLAQGRHFLERNAQAIGKHVHDLGTQRIGRQRLQ